MADTKRLAFLLVGLVVAAVALILLLATGPDDSSGAASVVTSPVEPAPAAQGPAATVGGDSRGAPAETRIAPEVSWWRPITEKTGRHFRVSSDCASDGIVSAALDAAESAWPATLALVGDLPRPGDQQLEVRLIRSRKDYKAADAEKLNVGHLKYASGWADYATRTAYVMLDGCAFDEEFAEHLGPGSDVTGLVAHEAAHLVASLCFPNSGWCPWFDEGIAMCVQEQALADRAPMTDSAATPLFSAEMSTCRRLRHDGLLPDVRNILRGGLSRLDGLDDHAVAWAFMRLLRRPERVNQAKLMFAQAQGLEGGSAFGQGLERTVFSVWGKAGVDELSAGLLTSVDAFVPQWDWPNSDRIDVIVGRWVQVAPPNQSKSAWRTERAGEPDYRVAGRFEILRRGGNSLAVFLGRTGEGGGVGVWFSAGKGIGVYTWSTNGGKPTTLSFESVVQPAIGRRTEFEVRVSRDDVHVLLDGREVLRTPLAGRDTSGQWGVAALDGSAGVWDDVRLAH